MVKYREMTVEEARELSMHGKDAERAWLLQKYPRLTTAQAEVIVQRKASFSY